MRLAPAALTITLATADEPLKQDVLRALEKLPHPASAANFQTVSHPACRNQGKTEFCWSFATCAFVESEMARLKLPPVHLSVSYPPYCEFLEKARRFAQTKGNSRFAAGDLFTALPEVCQKYGAVPATVYDLPTDKLPDHTRFYSELQEAVEKARQRRDWDEQRLVEQVMRILDRHLGAPPKSFEYEGKRYTPKSFAETFVRLPWSHYAMFTSFESAPFNTFTELKVPDNWRHNTNYWNLPLPAFYTAFKGAVRSGFSVVVSMDTTEPSYSVTGRYAFLPEFDLDPRGISQAAREFRFANGSTTDDHAVHFVGYGQVGGEDWFVASDSWKTVWRDGNRGELFLHSSYVQLKVLAFMVHSDAVPHVIAAPK